MKRTNRKVQSTAKSPVKSPENRRLHYLISLLMVAITLIVYSPVRLASFINCDDPDYVVRNPHVHSGLTSQSIRWAFTSSYQSNWHPLTWMSHMLDWSLFGPHPLGHHLVNVLFHVLSALVLFYLLRWMTGFTWRSAAVALLFAIHPLHVESVAWVAERKDVLSTFLWMLTLLAYVAYVKRESLGKYLLVIAAFVLGLMAKPMLVSLPVTMLLLDIWPLGRFAALGDKGGRRLIWEKVPFAALALGSMRPDLLGSARRRSGRPAQYLLHWRSRGKRGCRIRQLHHKDAVARQPGVSLSAPRDLSSRMAGSGIGAFPGLRDGACA